VPEFLKKEEREQVKDHHQVTATVLGRKKEATGEGTVGSSEVEPVGREEQRWEMTHAKKGSSVFPGAGVGRRQSQMQRGDCGKDLTGEPHFGQRNS